MPKGSGAGWVKVYPPGAFRGRDGWHIRGRDLYGRPIEGRLPPAVATERAARRLGQQLLKRSNGDPPAPAPVAEPAGPDRSFEAAAEAYRIARRPSKKEWDRIVKLIACKEIGPAHVDTLTTEQVSRFATDTMPHVKPDTQNREIVTPYSAVLHFAAELKWCTEVVIRRFHESEDEIRAVTPAEVDRLVANADATATYKPLEVTITNELAAYKVAALEYLRLPQARVGDLCRLGANDLDRAGHRLRVERYERSEWIEIPPHVVELFAGLDVRPGNRDGGGWLMPWRHRSGYHAWLRPLAEAAGADLSPRQLYGQADRDAALEAKVDAALQRMIALAGDTAPRTVTIERTDKNASYKVALLEFLRLRGTRISDVLALERAPDLDLQAAQVRLTIGKARDKVQWLPLSPLLVAQLANLAPCDGVFVFPWRTRSGVYKWLGPLCRRLGMDKVTPHMFRHALGEEAMDAEVDVLTLMNLGAWASLNSARRYARPSKSRLADADRQRELAARAPVHREMVAGDLEVPATVGNVVPIRRTA